MQPLLWAVLSSSTTKALTSNVSETIANLTTSPLSSLTSAKPSSINLDENNHRASFAWPEDTDDLPVNFPRYYNRYNANHRMHLTALIPFGVMLVLSTIIFVMVIFRRSPGVVSGIIAASLTFFAIYLLLFTLKQEVLVYE